MLDIVAIQNGADLQVEDSAAPRAANVLSTQIGEKEYLPITWGSDLEYFLTSSFQFQVANFQSYLVQRLVQHNINVGEVLTTIQPLFEKLTIPVGDTQGSKGYFTK